VKPRRVLLACAFALSITAIATAQSTYTITNACEARYAVAMAYCQQSYNPANCGTSACQQIILRGQNVCLSSALINQNTCAVTCLSDPNTCPSDTAPLPLNPVLYKAAVQEPIKSDGSSIFSAIRGVVPVKFSLTVGASATCELPPANIALTRTAGGTIGSVQESVYTLSRHKGSTFRISRCHYVYNLAVSSLGAGTYRVDVVIGGSLAGSGLFTLN
jgi:hypothetical protein